MTNYAEDKRFEIPAVFTAMNGAAQTFRVAFEEVVLFVEPVYEEVDGEKVMKNAEEVNLAQANLLRVLEILRSNGAQPIITKVEEKAVVFTVEQTYVYGNRDYLASRDIQVSARKHIDEALADIEALFVKPLSVDGKEFKAKAAHVDTIGSLV